MSDIGETINGPAGSGSLKVVGIKQVITELSGSEQS
jgi:hypothetical protein